MIIACNLSSLHTTLCSKAKALQQLMNNLNKTAISSQINCYLSEIADSILKAECL